MGDKIIYDTEFLGSLPYGCKYAPAIPCARRLNLDMSVFDNLDLNKYMSKIYKHDEVRQREWTRYKAFYQKGDEQRLFSTEILAPCDADISRLTKEARAELEKCKVYNKKQIIPMVKQLYVKYGANVLLFYALDMVFWKYFRHMESLFSGIRILSSHGIIQGEMRPLNIVFDNENKRFLFSNFMNSHDRVSFYDRTNLDVLGYPYFFFAPEMKYAHMVYTNSDLVKSQFTYAVQTELVENKDIDIYTQEFKTYTEQYFKKRVPSIFTDLNNRVKDVRRRDILKFAAQMNKRIMQHIEPNKQRVFEKEMALIAPAANVYALGATLFECLLIAFKQSKDHHKSRKQDNSSSDKRDDGHGRDLIGWSPTTQPLYEKLCMLISRMMLANPFDRISANDAYGQFMTLLGHVQEIYRDENAIINSQNVPVFLEEYLEEYNNINSNSTRNNTKNRKIHNNNNNNNAPFLQKINLDAGMFGMDINSKINTKKGNVTTKNSRKSPLTFNTKRQMDNSFNDFF